MNAILFSKDGTTTTVENVVPSTYLDQPVYVPPSLLTRWNSDGHLPPAVTGTWNRRRYIKQIESDDYAVFTEE